MTTSITNDLLGITVSIDQGSILIDGSGPDISSPLPYDGIFPYGYDFDIAGSADNFVLVYSGEFGLRDGKLVSLGDPDQEGVSYIGGASVAQFYGYDGVPIGDPIWMTSQTNQGHRPGIGALSNGDYLMVWQTNNPEGYPEIADRIGYIVGRRISHDGTQLGETFIISTGDALLQEGVPPVIAEVDGKITVSWNSYTSSFDGSSVIAGQSEDLSKIIYGGDADETWVSFESGDTIYGMGGNDLIDGGGNTDTLNGGRGNDTLIGGTGNDALTGGNGNDTVNAGSGNDLIVGGNGAGDDTYRGGLGIDTVKYTSATAGITVDLVAGGATSTAGSDAARIGTDQLSGIENIIAGSYADRITGSGAANRIDGMAGNDRIYGRGGNDTLLGGIGNDTLSGGAGADVLKGGAGQDRMTGGLEADLFVFTKGATGGNTLSTCDVIADFDSLEGDRISIKLIDADTTNGASDDAFAWIGTAAFNGTAGQLRYNTAGGDTYIEGDTNGDAEADFLILMKGEMALSAADFLL
jgi:Ca2+-binding RTX toxin-like protein